MKKRNLISIILYAVILVGFFSLLMWLFTPRWNTVSYSKAVELFENEQVKNFVVQDGELRMELRTPYNGMSKLKANLSDESRFREEMEDLIQAQRKAGILESYDFYPASERSPYELIFPLIVVGLAILLVWFFMMARINSNNAMSSFGKARTVLGIPDNQKVTFADVAGADEEKTELQEIVDFLRDPKKYEAIGARIPHGLLLVGPPGTGKTLLARATAGEAGVQFLSISGSDFVEMYVGVGASRVRDLFEQAKKCAPSIVFIDEIDAVGRKRGSGVGGGHDEREQTLNQLLVEMDGFRKNEGVIVLAATNRADILDPALLRPGRFDRQIYVNTPDARGREAILRVHAKNKRLDDSVDLKTVARVTTGFTGADLSNLLNEAAIMAARENRPVLSMKDLNDAMMKITAGVEKRSQIPQRKDLKITAIHEAGHAVAMYQLPTQDMVMQITVIPRGRSLGATWHIPHDDRAHMTRNEMYEQIVGLLGGRVAEALYVGDITTGASNDIDRATKIARDMVARYGMCEKLGTISYTSDGEVFIGRDFEKTKSYSEKVAASIDDEVKLLMDKAYAHCTELLKAKKTELLAVADYLLEHETMSGEQFRQCMEGKEITEQASETVMFTQPTSPDEQE